MSPLLVTAALCLAAPPASDATPAFEALKALEGNWKTQDKDAPKFVSYRVISNATAVLEMVTGADRQKVSSAAMYHLDGGKLIVTHYGPGGASRLEARGSGKLEFEAKGGAVTSIVLTTKGDDKLTHTLAGASGKATLELTREYVDSLK